MNPEFFHEDYALWLTLAREGAVFKGLPERLMHYRIWSNGRSYNKIRSGYKRLEIYRKQEHMNIFQIAKSIISHGYHGIKKGNR